jgi:Ser/Thr protein kinase RdoA (MazF antagonist)
MTADRLELMARDALRRFGVHQAGVTLLNISENATFAVDEATGERTVLRLHRPDYHSRAGIESELAWVTALREDGVVSTPPVLPAAGGERVVTAEHPDGERRDAVRFAWVQGTQPAGEHLSADFRALGAIAARLHAHSRRWPRPSGFTRLSWGYETSIGPRGNWGRWQRGIGVGPAEHAVLAGLDGALRRRLAAFGAGADRFGLVHADMRLANLLVHPEPDGRRTVHVIDFDDCGFGWFLYDLGASLSFIEHEPFVPELIDAWAEGYRRVAPLTADEQAELPTFVLLRRLLLIAWLGSHADTDLARQLGADFTRVSCDLAEDYLSGR